MVNKGVSRSNLFLIELIIVIMFFSFAGIITLQLFLKADHIAIETVGLNGAIMLTQTAAETAKSTKFESLNELPLTTYFDKNWQPTRKEIAVYTLDTKMAFKKMPAGSLVTFIHTVNSPKITIYTLESQKYYSGKWGQVNKQETKNEGAGQ